MKKLLINIRSEISVSRLPGDGAVAGGDEQEARTGEQGVPYMETVYGTKEEVQDEDAPLRKGLMWLQKGKLFSRYVLARTSMDPVASCEKR